MNQIAYVTPNNDRAPICKSLRQQFPEGVAVTDRKLTLANEAGDLVDCYELVVNESNQVQIRGTYRAAPRWLYRAARRNSYALPMCWCSVNPVILGGAA